MIGDFLNAIIAFVMVAAAIYFFIVVPMNKLTSMRKAPPAAAPTAKKCPECLSDIPIAARRYRKGGLKWKEVGLWAGKRFDGKELFGMRLNRKIAKVPNSA
jgi:hypothetical protein